MKMEFTQTEVWGFRGALRGMRNPLNSWEKADSTFDDGKCVIGPNDMKLAQALIKGGNEHSKFLRMIHVQVDADMPRYWWQEADCYKFGSKNSCSTMHKLLNNKEPITVDLFIDTCVQSDDIDALYFQALQQTVDTLEKCRSVYRDTSDVNKKNHLLTMAKRLLPEGFMQKRTWDTNYQELRTMYFQRRNHRLEEEWCDTFCKWVESLPYARELILFRGE